jgi:hypothetical protein
VTGRAGTCGTMMSYCRSSATFTLSRSPIPQPQNSPERANRVANWVEGPQG